MLLSIILLGFCLGNFVFAIISKAGLFSISGWMMAVIGYATLIVAESHIKLLKKIKSRLETEDK